MDTQQQILELQRQIDELKSIIFKNSFSNLYVFDTPVRFRRDIILDGADGTKIGTATSNKISVYGVTPIIQQSAITAPTGGVTIDSQSRTAIGTIITVLKNFGITA